jgi:ABC-type antimicrobial peptide transport system permease subunit
LEPLDGDIITLSGYSRPRAPSEVINASSLRPVPWALVGFLVVLGIASVTHAVHSTLRRRRRELAVLRALGFGPADERTAIRWQAACIAIVALVLGLPLGVIGGRLVFETLVEDAGLERTFATSAFVIAGAVIATICALQLLAVVLGSRAGRLRPAAVLRAE